MNNSKSLISVIIPTKNASKFIDRCLDCIYGQTYPFFEIIIVNQGSDAVLQRIIRKYKRKDMRRLVLISTDTTPFYSPPSRSRNIGARYAKGDILIHLDADMYMHKDLLKSIQRQFKNKNLVAVVIPEHDIYNNYWGGVKSLERRCYWSNKNIESARAVRTRIFNAVKGYDTAIQAGEDLDVHRAYSDFGDIEYSNSYISHDLREFSLINDLRKKHSYGRTARFYFEKNNVSTIRYVTEEFMSYFRHIDLLIREPHHGFGLFFLKSLELLVGYMGMIRGKR